jgi:hypothetical protein
LVIYTFFQVFIKNAVALLRVTFTLVQFDNLSQLEREFNAMI